MSSTGDNAFNRETISDEEVVARVLAGEEALFEIVVRRHHRRLYCVARAILRDDSETEDVMQSAYASAYEHLGQFAGRSKFSTWLTRIAVHEALGRGRRSARYQVLEPLLGMDTDPMDSLVSLNLNPEQQASRSELRGLLEKAAEKLPDGCRAVFVLRDLEELSTIDAANALGITTENVKTRLYRARALLRKKLTHVRQWKTRKYWN
jgi:RNA polymerase sigma-70 factor, ECF subfamily